MFYSSLSYVHRENEGYNIKMKANSFELNKNHSPNINITNIPMTNYKLSMMYITVNTRY
jgi:hypothetical protein